MSFHRATLVALATLFTLGMTSLASAQCCNNWSYSLPVNSGCGGCGTPAYAAVYAVPVAPAPIAVSSCCGGGGWSGGAGWGGCGCGGGFAGASSLYVVNQGPQFSGPGLTVPYGTYAPQMAYAPATDYPYAPAAYGPGYDPGYGYGPPPYRPYYSHRYYRPRYAYRGPGYGRPRYFGGGPRYFHPGPRYWR